MKSKVLKLKKVTTNWYRIPIKIDRWGISTEFVDILRTRFGDWSVCDGESEIGLQADDMNRYVFIKLRAAKAFAQDLSLAIQNETPFPRVSDDKYLDLEI
ncbi:MAG: hypothetical protein WC679_01185 [Bacteroidales bacterium]|jgi:hypothetical protein